jgi:hypothetical protein
VFMRFHCRAKRSNIIPFAINNLIFLAKATLQCWVLEFRSTCIRNPPESHRHERAQQLRPWSNVYLFRERGLQLQRLLEMQPLSFLDISPYSLDERLLAANLNHPSTVLLWRRQLFAWISEEQNQHEISTARRGKPTGGAGKASDASSFVPGSTGSPPIMPFAREAMLDSSLLCNLWWENEVVKINSLRRR